MLLTQFIEDPAAQFIDADSNNVLVLFFKHEQKKAKDNLRRTSATNPDALNVIINIGRDDFFPPARVIFSEGNMMMVKGLFALSLLT